MKVIEPVFLLRGVAGPALKSSEAVARVYHKTVKPDLNPTLATVKNIVSIAGGTLILAGSY